MKPIFFSAPLQLVLIAYFQMVEWLDLFPWNNLRYENGHTNLVILMGMIQVIMLVGCIKRVNWLMKAGLAFYFIWFALQLFNWWFPYFFGASPMQLEMYQLFYLDTYKFLLPIKGNFVPDANHVILHLLIFFNVGFIFKDLYEGIDLRNYLSSENFG